MDPQSPRSSWPNLQRFSSRSLHPCGRLPRWQNRYAKVAVRHVHLEYVETGPAVICSGRAKDLVFLVMSAGLRTDHL